MSPPMTPTITKAYASTAQGQIHYQYARASSFISKKKTPLIFLHKSASSSASYTSLISIYSSRGYDCYAPDMPGFGGSFDPSEDQIAAIRERGTKWYCEVFMEAFHDIGVFGKHENSVEGTLTTAHVMGHHSGACLAVELAVLYPNLINSICLVGPAVMSAEERLAMKDVYFKPFNKPETDGSHLIKTWNYLQSAMGIGPDINLLQREAIDHIRAWKGRNLIYGAVWDQDATGLYCSVNDNIGVLLMCARDDVLWKYFDFVKGLRENVKSVEVSGGNFELDRDFEGIQKHWTSFLDSLVKI